MERKTEIGLINIGKWEVQEKWDKEGVKIRESVIVKGEGDAGEKGKARREEGW